ncbi:hypothetical protein LINGRAHAP2_LOCUS31231 [Linum grandiflorum]
MEPTKEFDGGGGGGGDDEKANQIHNPKEVKRADGGGSLKGKSCSGYLYYTTALKSNAKNPRCIGIPRTLPSVPNYVGKNEDALTGEKSKFYYGCAGYSVYTKDDHLADKKESKTPLPVCLGLELLINTKQVTAADAPSPAPVHHRQEERESRAPPQTSKPTQFPADDFLTRWASSSCRFTRNANLVASGVTRNVKRVGNQIKDTVEDIFFPYKRRPK